MNCAHFTCHACEDRQAKRASDLESGLRDAIEAMSAAVWTRGLNELVHRDLLQALAEARKVLESGR